MGSKLGALLPKTEPLMHGLANRSLASGGLAKHGSTHTNLLTANVVPYTINGIYYSKAATANIATGSLAVLDEAGNTAKIVPLPAKKARAYLLVIDKDGDFKVVQGIRYSNTGRRDDVANDKTPTWPGCPREHAPIGGVIVANGHASNAFTFGTTALNATDVTATYFNFAVVPSPVSP